MCSIADEHAFNVENVRSASLLMRSATKRIHSILDDISSITDEAYTSVNSMHNALLYTRSADDSFVSSAEYVYSAIQRTRPATDTMGSATERMVFVSERINSAVETMQSVTDASYLHANSMCSVIQSLCSLMKKYASAVHALNSGGENNNSIAEHMRNGLLQMRAAVQCYVSRNDFIHSGHDTTVSPDDLNISGNETIRS